jgi:hypothetical protein
MDVVVVVEELLAPGPSVVDGVEVAGPCRAVLERLEVRLDVGVVVTHVGPGVGPGDPEVLQQLGHGLRGHRRTPVGMQGELALGHALPGRVVGNVEQHAPLRNGGEWSGQPVIGVKPGVRSHMDVRLPRGRHREDAHRRVGARSRSFQPVVDERS